MAESSGPGLAAELYLLDHAGRQSPTQLPLGIAGRLGSDAIHALYATVGGEVPADLLGAANPPATSTHPDRRIKPISVVETVSAGVPPAVFQEAATNRQTMPGATLATAGLVTVTRSSAGAISSNADPADKQRPWQSVRRMPKNKTHMALLALRASANGELPGATQLPSPTSLAGHWATRATIESSLAQEPRRRWLFIDSSALIITGASIRPQIISLEELLLIYKLSGSQVSLRSHDLLGLNQTSKEFGLAFTALGDRLNRPEHRMLLRKRGAKNRRYDSTGHRWYRMANDVLVSDTNLEKALAA